jgi:hypothetical protein
LENNMKLVRRGAVAVLLAASLTSGALVGVSQAASEDDAVASEEIAVVEMLDQDIVAIDEVEASEEHVTSSEATTEEAWSVTGATDGVDVEG